MAQPVDVTPFGLVVGAGSNANVDPFGPVIGTPTVAYYYLGADVSTGNWTPSAGVSLFGVLDETDADTADYIVSGTDPVADTCEMRFANVLTPVDATNHAVAYWLKGDNGCAMLVELIAFQGGQILGTVASWTHSPAPPVWTFYDQPVTPVQAATISDYPNVRLRVTAG